MKILKTSICLMFIYTIVSMPVVIKKGGAHFEEKIGKFLGNSGSLFPYCDTQYICFNYFSLSTLMKDKINNCVLKSPHSPYFLHLLKKGTDLSKFHVLGTTDDDSSVVCINDKMKNLEDSLMKEEEDYNPKISFAFSAADLDIGKDLKNVIQIDDSYSPTVLKSASGLTRYYTVEDVKLKPNTQYYGQP
jgi:hypothetical protein